MKIIPIGGRIKAASVGMEVLFPEDHNLIDDHLKFLKKHPPLELLKAFFPSDFKRIKHLLNCVGFFRPILKTDQGMGGNFLPFSIDLSRKKSNLNISSIQVEEGIAIPELHHNHDEKLVALVKEAFHKLHLEKAYKFLQPFRKLLRQAEKGRDTFFFIRPAITKEKIIFGEDIVTKVNTEINKVLGVLFEKARILEEEYSGRAKKNNLLYCQSDVFVLSDGSVFVEKIHCPDVGFFLTEIDASHSAIFPFIKSIMNKLHAKTCDGLTENYRNEVAIVTRDEVLNNYEDILEYNEIKSLQRGFKDRGVNLTAYSVSDVDKIPYGQQAILLNIDYSKKETRKLLECHSRGEIECYPNPFVQIAAQNITGLREFIVPEKHKATFFNLVSSNPKNDKARADVIGRLNKLLYKHDVSSDVIHADIGHETIPVFTKSLFSWRQIVRRIKRYNDDSIKIKIRKIPDSKFLVTSNTGPRLHGFRFMLLKT